MKPVCSANKKKCFVSYLLLVYLLLNKKKKHTSEHTQNVLLSDVAQDAVETALIFSTDSSIDFQSVPVLF